jgi:hypothetical protein
MSKEFSTSIRAEISPTHPRVTTHVLPPSALVKSTIVNALGRVLAWRPLWAMLLGRLIFWGFPRLREA